MFQELQHVRKLPIYDFESLISLILVFKENPLWEKKKKGGSKIIYKCAYKSSSFYIQNDFLNDEDSAEILYKSWTIRLFRFD